MKLLVHTAGGISSCEAKESRPLSETLREAGIGLDLRCGGNGRCGRCRIELVRGDFVAAGRQVSLRGKETAAVNACTCFPAGAEGEIRIPAASLHRSDGAVEVNFSPVPDLSGGPGGLSVAVDIGTTTVAALLVEDGRIVASAGMPNRQFRFGDNVIDRIAACQSSPGAQRELHRAVVDETINPLLAQLAADPRRISRMAVAANTVMTHLFYNESPVSIGTAPFTPKFRRFPEVAAASLGVAIRPEGRIIAAPAISGNVGGDITAGLVATGFGASGGTELLLDLGTNCEMVLAHRGKVWASSAAAGPAFEGANLSFGCRAAPGAVEHLTLSAAGKLELQVSGGGAPIGLCGSGTVDFLAEARRAGALDEYGRLELGVLRRWGRLVTRNGGNGFRIASGIVVTEADIERLLKAKAAVGAGIASLLRHAGVEPEEIRIFHLCGGFARCLDLDAAQAIGMLPRLERPVFRIGGNTSLAGAVLLAARPDRMAEFEKWADLPCDLPLNSLKGFEESYIDGLLLG